jgi:hypothetical protein
MAKRVVWLAARKAEASLEALESEKNQERCEVLVNQVRPIRYQHMSRPNLAFDFFEDYRDMVSVHAVQDRFHLGALAYHDNVLDEARLRLIESWLQQFASITVLMVAPDEDWYKWHLTHESKQEMFTVDRLMEANRTFLAIAGGTYKFPVQFDRIIYVGQEEGYPDDDTMSAVLTRWYQLLMPLTR